MRLEIPAALQQEGLQLAGASFRDLSFWARNRMVWGVAKAQNPPKKISFGGIPNSRNIWFFYKSFWSVLETPQLGFRELNGRKTCWIWLGSAPKPPRPSPEPSPEPCWTWPGSAPKPPGTFSWNFLGTLLNLIWFCTKASQTFFSGTVSRTCWTWPGAKLPDLHRNLLRNPVEPDLALHQSLPDLRNLLRNTLNLTWLCTKAFQTFTGTLSATLLNLIWFCTKASQTFFSGTVSRTLLNLTWCKAPRPSPEPSPEPCWTWPGSAPKPPRPPEPSPEYVEPDLALHQSLPDLHRNLIRNPVEPDLALHRTLPDLLRNLRNLLRNLVEPDPAPAPVHTGAILGWRPH